MAAVDVAARRPERTYDVALAAVYLGLTVWEVLEKGGGNASGFVFAVVLAAPMTARSRFPLVVSVVYGGLLVSTSWVLTAPGDMVTPFIGPLLALYSAGRLLPVSGMLLALAVDIGAIALFTRAEHPHGVSYGDATGLCLAFVVSLAVGRATREMQFEADAVRREAAEAEARHEAQVEEATHEERLRIARELHDVLGHAVSVMGLQAAGVRRRLLPEQQLESEALRSVEETGRQAVEELRKLLGVLRSDARAVDPAEGGLGSAARAWAVVDEVSAAGVHVRAEGLEVVDTLPPALALTVVRIVQEGLTNVLRHAPGSRATVAVRHEGGALQVLVEDDGGDATARPGSEGGGFGLAGMAERVAVFGGCLEAGPREPRGFALRAELPAVAP